MGSVVQPYLPPVVLSRIKEAIACGLVGVVVGACVYGITVLQTYIYFQNSRQDSGYTRSFVAFLFILDTLSLVFAVDAIYQSVVTDFGDPFLLINMPLAFALENAATVLIGTLTQCFLAHRLWKLSRHNIALVYSIIILALCSFGPGMVLSVKLYSANNVDIIFQAWSLEGRTLSSVANALSAMCDIVIAAALCYYLHSKRTQFRGTNSMIDRLIIYAVNRGALTALCQAGEMITAIARPDRYIYLPFGILSGKLYCNTLLATLNAQKSMRKDSNNVIEVGTLPNFRMDTTSGGHGNSDSRTTQSLDNINGACVIMPTFAIDISRASNKTVDVVQTPNVDSDA